MGYTSNRVLFQISPTFISFGAMRYFRISCGVTLFMALMACGTAPSEPKEVRFDLSKLQGNWTSTSDRSFRFEEWQYEPSGEMKGKGYVLESGDTTFIEFLRIAEENGVLTYFAQSGDENNGEVIPFQVGDQSATQIEFRNPQHDFPTRIVYRLIGSDSLLAFIEGPGKSKLERINFHFVRAAER
jgi:hypothetical protein